MGWRNNSSNNKNKMNEEYTSRDKEVCSEREPWETKTTKKKQSTKQTAIVSCSSSLLSSFYLSLFRMLFDTECEVARGFVYIKNVDEDDR